MTYNKTYIITLLTILLFGLINPLTAQQKIEKKFIFRSPVDFTMTLAGNFGELRAGHFHSGADIRTFTKGKRVYAVADGYISRIKVSPTGYGNALYINHPQGYTTVYAHLDRFNSTIQKFVHAKQYQKKTFAVDITLNAERFPVKKGEIIAISGNSGSSAGPHLHFEIRDTKTEHPLNPLTRGLKIKDTKAPRIYNLYVYPMDEFSCVNGKNSRQCFPAIYTKSGFRLKGNPQIVLAGNIGFALEVKDYLDDSWAKCGIYSLQTKVNNTVISNFVIDEINFETTRFINSHMDYELHINKGKKIHKIFKSPNNPLHIYKTMVNDGIYHFSENNKYKIELTAKDAKGNTANLLFYAAGKNNTKPFQGKNYSQLMSWQKENSYIADNVEIKFKPNTFYNDLPFRFFQKIDTTHYSNIISVDKITTPVQKYYSLSIKCNNIPHHLENKVFIAHFDKKGRLSNKGGIYINGWVKTKTNVMGDFVVAVDTIPPTIKARTNLKSKKLRLKKQINFTIDDNLSGIKSYKGTIDGNWALFEYDPKKKNLFYRFDKYRLSPKKNHSIHLIVTDKGGNKKAFSGNFYW